MADRGMLFLAPRLFGHQAFTVAGHYFVHAQGLTDQIGHHGQEPDILVKADLRGIVDGPVDGQSAHHLFAVFDRHPHQRKSDTAFGPPTLQIHPGK